ncbi:methyl-accepting chemotaxis protein [Rubrivivax gelatinosus]|nr:methyl-accepting chemotaxis protein [Rubrivivax gelatinosus]
MLKTLSGAKSIGRRLSTVLALVLLISFVGSGFGYWALSRTAAANQDMLEDSLVSERLASDWYRNISGGVNRTTAIAVSSDANLGKFFADVSAESTKQSTELQKKLEPMMKTEAEKALYEKLAATRKIYLGSRDEVYAARQAGEAEKAHDIFQNKFQPAAAQFQDAIRALVQMQRDELDAEAVKAADANRAARIALVVFGTCALVVGAALALWLTRSITVPLNEAVEVADTIASFDLSRPITPRGEDETGRLLRSLQSMQSSLRRLIGEVRASTDSIGTASSEIASGNMDLSARTEQTASNLQQAAASMTQLASTVRQTADAAGTASGLANTAASVAQRGGEVVSQVVSTMDEISTSSHRISDIIGVIDGIAFQTNILALNAAVEAARAGEQGRGFAVVAGEVRSLAQRSAQAAREIKGLIGSAVDSVETGSRMVQEAGSTMTELVASVQRVNQLIGEIGNATREQSDGISQLNAGVSQLDQMTQQNAALVEEAASAAGSLKDQSTRLASAVSVFRL